jgi:hypothetical protein
MTQREGGGEGERGREREGDGYGFVCEGCHQLILKVIADYF